MVPFEARPLFIRHFRFSNARVSLSRGILIGFGRLAVRRTDGGTSFLPLERIPFGVLDRFPDSRKTHDRGCCLVKGGDRPASKNKRSRDATQERNRCCRCVRGGEVFASDEESFHGRRGTMGNLKTRARRTRVFLSFPFLRSFVLQIFHPLQSSSRRASREMNIPKGVTIAEDLVFVHDRRRAINRVYSFARLRSGISIVSTAGEGREDRVHKHLG